MKRLALILSLFVLASLLVTGCAPTEKSTVESCPVTEPVWVKPPEDAAVSDSMEYGDYFANEDQSILASAWWAEPEAYQQYASEDGVKVGWFRPEGAALQLTGRRLDGDAPPLEAHVPCCYPTRFQATGLSFPTEGCWEVVAKAADSELAFTVWIVMDE